MPEPSGPTCSSRDWPLEGDTKSAFGFEKLAEGDVNGLLSTPEDPVLLPSLLGVFCFGFCLDLSFACSLLGLTELSNRLDL